MLSVVVPTFNRLANLKLCLAALGHQVDYPEFDIVIADDGSVDGTLEWLFHEFPSQSNNPKSRHRIFTWTNGITLTYLYCGPNAGFRGGRSRNIAAANCEGDRLVFVDSDVALNQFALKGYQVAHDAHPEAIIVGLYHWIPPYNWEKYPDRVHLLWDSPSLKHLIDAAEGYGMKYISEYDNAITGEDVRASEFGDDVNLVRHKYGMGAWTGNISYPRDLFFSVGGFDERIVGHGGEDADLGLTADEHGADWILYAPIFGFHLYHDRDDAKNQRETVANLAYIERKHGIGSCEGKRTNEIDWDDAGNYHRHFGALAIQEAGEKLIYAIRSNHGIGLKSMSQLKKMGFDPLDTVLVPKGYLQKHIIISVQKE